VLTAAEEEEEKQETKSLPTSAATEEQQAAKAQKTKELKTGKRGANGKEENLGPFKEDSREEVGQADRKPKSPTTILS